MEGSTVQTSKYWILLMPKSIFVVPEGQGMAGGGDMVTVDAERSRQHRTAASFFSTMEKPTRRHLEIWFRAALRSR